jgi:hypothetical protein
MSERKRYLTPPPPPNRIPGGLGRVDMLKLAAMPLGTFVAIFQRGYGPLGPTPGPEVIMSVPRPVIPKQWQDWADARGYTPLSALALLVAQEFIDRFGVSREFAAQAAVHLLHAAPHWQRVSEDAKAIAEGRNPGRPHVMLGAFSREGSAKFSYAIGTARELANQFIFSQGYVAVSVSAAAGLLRKRAQDHGIELQNFWAE